MSKRNFAPRSRQFNERLIERIQSRYAAGLSRDTEGLDLSYDAIADLINARAFETTIEGRPGTELLTPADWGVTITDNTETLSVAIQSGEMYAAAGRNKTADTVPAKDSIFMVYGIGDTTGNDLETAKGSAPRKYDVFKVDNKGIGTEAISYLGSIRLPAIVGFGDTVANEITASKSGNIITASAGPSFTPSLVYQYFEWGDGAQDFITGYTDATHITVLNSGTIASTGKCRCHGVVNASMYHESEKKFVLFIGDKLYYANNVPWYSWTEIPLAGGYYLPDDSFCKMYEFDKDLIMINPSGFYRIKLDTPRYWRINEEAPLAGNRPADVDSLVQEESIWLTKRDIEYRYLYAHSRIRNTSSFVNNRIDANSTLEWQSGPIKADTDGRDYFIMNKQRPIGPQHPSVGEVLGSTTQEPGLLLWNDTDVVGNDLAGDYIKVSGWTPIVDGSLDVTLSLYQTDTTSESFTKTVGLMDFSPAKTFEDIAAIIEAALNQTFLAEKIRWNVVYFINSSGAQRIIIFLDTPGVFVTKVAAGSSGTSIFAILGFTLSNDDFTIVRSFYEGNVVGPIVIPSTLKTATHISLYRTARLDEVGVRAGNNANQYVLVDDVPLVNVWIGNVAQVGSDYFYTPTTGTFSERDAGNTLVAEGALSPTISVADTVNSRYKIDLSSAYTGLACALGAANVFRASVAGSTMTIFSGHSLSSADNGKAVWFASGKLVWIKEVLTPSTATLTEPVTIALTAAAMNPVARYINDTVFDSLYPKDTAYPSLQPRIKKFSLPSRFIEEMPNSNIGIVVPGWILATTQGKNVFQYSDTAKDYLAGQYAADLQYNDKIDSSIQEFIQQNDYVGIRSEYATWRLNLAVTIELGNSSVGENVDGFNDPEIIDSSIGVEREGGTAVLENGNFLTFTSEPAVREFNMHEYSPNIARDRIQESDIQKLQPVTILFYDHILGAILWGEK